MSVKVNVVCAVADLKLRQRIEQIRELATQSVVAGNSDASHFEVKFVEQANLTQTTQTLVGANPSDLFVFVSDQFVAAGATGQTADATPSVAAVRQIVAANRAASLIGIAETNKCRTTGIDWLLPPARTDAQSVFDAVKRAVTALLLKLPPRNKPKLAEGKAIRVSLVHSPEVLEQCFKLRFKIYSALSYLDDSIALDPSNMDIDSFDASSFHFAAILYPDEQLVGTMRVIVPEVQAFAVEGFLGKPSNIIRVQRQWCESIGTRVMDSRYHQLITQPYLMPLKVLQSFDFIAPAQAAPALGPPVDGWTEMLGESSTLCELSRMVVDLPFRGMDISTLMARTAIAGAVILGRRRMLLSCIPMHETLYAKHGFARLPVSPAKDPGTNQEAIAMQLELDDSALSNEAVARAQLDIGMMKASHQGRQPAPGFGARHLCLCRRELCWKNDYSERTSRFCPLCDKHKRQGN